jgi:methylated-DNA-[protein]-cysteine S-methyltransferase
MHSHNGYFPDMNNESVALFDTPIGVCAIVWGEGGVTGVQLPEESEAGTRARVLRRYPDAVEAAPPPPIASAIADIVALLSGAPKNLCHIALDMARVPEFHRRVYAIAQTIPPGATMTYGEVATKLGDRMLAQQVGQALGKNPFPIIVPCHRVLAASGATGGFSAPGGITTKLRMLSIEGARTSDQPMLFDRLDLAARPR